MVALISSLLNEADFQRLFSQLSKLRLLDLVFDLMNFVEFSSPAFVSIIIFAFKQAVISL